MRSEQLEQQQQHIERSLYGSCHASPPAVGSTAGGKLTAAAVLIRHHVRQNQQEVKQEG